MLASYSALLFAISFPLEALCSASAPSYEFIVIGGGTAGLAFAARLSEKLPDDRILVLEAGGDGRADPRIYVPGLRGSAYSSVYDWNLTTVPQPGLNDRRVAMTRGRVLGGTSAINLMVWDKAARAEYDVWGQLGNPGWDWTSMQAAMLRSENFQRQDGPIQYGDDGVGRGGPIQTSFNEDQPPHVRAGIPTMEALGAASNLETLDGNPLGVAFQPSMVRLSNHTRSYSPDYLPLQQGGIVIMYNTSVRKINLETHPTNSSSYSNRKASGVTLANGEVILATKEVILSAGTFQSPQILELSGIGGASALKAVGIPQLVDLPGVGENLQDHLRIQESYVLRPSNMTVSADVLRFNATRAALELSLYNQGKPSLYDQSGSCYAFLTWKQAFGRATADSLLRLARSVTSRDNNVVDSVKISYLDDPSIRHAVPQLELIFSDGYTGPKGRYPFKPGSAGYGDQFVTLIASVLHPLARGSVHVTASAASGDALPSNDSIKIDPHHLGNEYDRTIMALVAQYLRKVAHTQPLRDLWTTEFEPGEDVIPLAAPSSSSLGVERGGSDDDGDRQQNALWRAYARNVTGTLYHPVGTCAMLPRRHGGVVDFRLRVYGVERLRVVDASVIPVALSAHIQTAVYGIAERAADLVAKEWKRKVNK